MKKKGIVGRLTVLTLVLCLVTMSLTAGTLAKYASEASGTATATVAKWAIKFTDGGSTEYDDTTQIALNLKDTAKENANLVAADKIAPGTTGSFQLAVDGTGTEVAFTYTIEMDMSDPAIAKAPVKFYSDSTCNTPLTVTGGKATLTGDVLTNAASKKSTQTVYWKWDATDYDNTLTGDKLDTKVGTDSAAGTLTYNIPVTIKAEQKVS